ncbi:ABC transporter ATP-binding protein [Leucobacter insecticola]|uniref:ABC transporter ATP-binding protein n=1 Tax=Leucobacter insecticola TaxID=2714934 RepID=A0A6G8FHP1_9MICO|nr:ABC transporter ATP-binding protein [Leucobacter insecticola]QIM15871.1 ABC transporter ATP-binding protein [Leucobacter insecticola]
MRAIWMTLKGLFGVLPKGAVGFYVGYSIVTGLLAILDTVALALVMLVATSLVSDEPLKLPLLGEVPVAATTWVVVAICGLFIAKSGFALLLHWRATRRFAKYELHLGNQLFERYAHSSWERRSRLSTADVTRIVDGSVSAANRGFILPLSQVPGNGFTFIAVLLVLVVAQPLTALIAFVYLTAISGGMQLLVSRRARLEGLRGRNYSYRVATIMTEMVDALKEVTLRGKLNEAGQVIARNRAVVTRARANMSFLGILPKYVFEATLIGGFLLIGGAAYWRGGFPESAIAISMFAAAGFRMIPAMNQVQASITAASANEAFAQDVIRELTPSPEDVLEGSLSTDSERLPQSLAKLELRDVSFHYSGNDQLVLDRLSLTIPFGSSLAIVGPSGAGKSTLIDILLGLSVPTSGSIMLDGHPLELVMQQWRSRVGYVPQRVALFNGTIAQNVALTWEDGYDPGHVTRALERAQVTELLDRPEGIDALLGERGTLVSGGQQQRLGIARALYADPYVMVMDEATSSLDTETENRVVESMQSLQGSVTFITVAHRLATIRDYDQVCYLDRGKILGSGTFDEVVAAVPDFKRQAELAGLI